MQYAPDLYVIKLSRNPLVVARSCLDRNKKLFVNFPRPDAEQNEIRVLNWQYLTKYQIYLLHCLDLESRFERLKKCLREDNIFFLETEELNNIEKIKDLFEFMGVKHKTLKDLSPTNFNKANRFTKVAPQDLKEAKELFRMIEPSCDNKLTVLHKYNLTKD